VTPSVIKEEEPVTVEADANEVVGDQNGSST
jgi:hypothetical protein